MNPFDDDAREFRVLVNGEGRYAIWPAFLDVPGGWTVVIERASRVACLEHVARTWTGPRPRRPREPADG